MLHLRVLISSRNLSFFINFKEQDYLEIEVPAHQTYFSILHFAFWNCNIYDSMSAQLSNFRAGFTKRRTKQMNNSI